MSFATVRRTLFTVHMWLGLVLGLFLAALGLSGSVLVYDDAFANLLDRPPQALTAGMPLPLSMIQSIARDAADQRGVTSGQMQIILPEKPLQPITVRLGGISVMGNMPGMAERRARDGARGAGEGTRREGAQGAGRAGGLQLFIDPVSGEVLGSRKAAAPGLLIFAHQLHGNFLMGREGRTYVVGWLGVAMVRWGFLAWCCGGRKRVSGNMPSRCAASPRACASIANCTPPLASGSSSSSWRSVSPVW